MIVINFGKWNHAALAKYVYTRIYRKGYHWTPFCRRTLRNLIQDKH